MYCDFSEVGELLPPEPPNELVRLFKKAAERVDSDRAIPVTPPPALEM
jgi:hypothetical protein